MSGSEPRPGVDRILGFEETLRTLQQWVGRVVNASVGGNAEFHDPVGLKRLPTSMHARGVLDRIVDGELLPEITGERFVAFIVSPGTRQECARITLYRANFQRGIWPKDWDGLINVELEDGISITFCTESGHLDAD